MKLLKKPFHGFTLVELIIVITILAILATIAFISFQNYTRDARDASRGESFLTLEKGLDIFFVKSGNYPFPDNSIVFTGGNSAIQMGVVGDAVSKLISVRSIPTDPLTKERYVYSVGGNGYYYQIAGERENVVSSIFNTAYALGETKVPLVRGNYKLDPTLPSLIPVKTSVTASGIFDPNVCFIVDAGENNFSSTNANCIKKKDMSLKSGDESLVGYWDMETFSGSLLKDLSGNGNDGVLSGVSLPTNTGAFLGKGYYFSSGIILVNFNSESSLNTEGSRYMTIVSIFKVENKFNTFPRILEAKTSLGTTSYLVNLTNTGVPINSIGSNFYGSSSSIIRSYSKAEEISFGKYYIHAQVLNEKTAFSYINGNKSIESDDGAASVSPDSFDGIKGPRGGILYIGNNIVNGTRQFNGVIDEIKIYNRALSLEEIAQQARMAGF